MEFISLILCIPILVSFSVLCIISPIRIVQIIYLWPVLTKKLLRGFMYPSKSENMLSLAYKNPDKYLEQYKFQIYILQITGILGLLLAMAAICALSKII